MAARRDVRVETAGTRAATMPPRRFVVALWHVPRPVVRPKPGRWGALWLTTTGRRTGRRRRVLVGYLEDGDSLVTMAMNGWGPGEPAWWLNLQAHPDTTVTTRDGVRPVRAHRAEGPERD